MKRLTYEELNADKAKDLVAKHESFEVVGLSGRMKSAVVTTENQIESQGLRCRVYTYGRIAAAGATVFGGVTGLVGITSAAGIAAHNLATFNPDYEICKHPVSNKLTVKYKKE